MNPALTHIHDTLQSIKNEIKEEIIGQDAMIDRLIITFFAGGHALLEGVPGLGKTRTIRTFAKVLGLDTGRISFTPDLLPSDLTGNEIYRQQKGEFTLRKGPIFTHILLADEINRTPPKVQSALLEAMEEKKVTIGEKTLDLPSPFVVFATQNPLEHEGTYPLPEAQLDRFLMRIIISHPSIQDEKNILKQECLGGKKIQKTEEVTEKKKKEDLLEMIDYIAKSVRVDEHIYTYITDILSATRKITESVIEKEFDSIESRVKFGNAKIPLLSYGASTRAGLAMIRAGRVRAIMSGRDYMLPEDVKLLAHDILDHRIGLSYEAASEGLSTYTVTEKILDTVQIP
ncbi:AAA family ATPase [Candidatus Gracilibacteria bacterium]|nr:AAA family ATPase [Candidatus Gracilibacteria bacterium]